MTKQLSIMWFRQDLRLQDNPALFEACKHGTVLPVYILDDTHPQQFQPGGASKWWLHHSLATLNASLGDRLHILKGDPIELIESLIDKSGATTVFWNRTYEPWQIARDKQLKVKLKAKDIQVASFNGSLLWEPWNILNQSGSVYKVFTPYYRRGCLNATAPRHPISAPECAKYQYIQQLDQGLETLCLLPDKCWYQGFEKHWQPGEQGAKQHLSQFLNNSLGQYKQGRDVPSLNATSRLSAHLHFGEISPNQVWYAAINKRQDCVEETNLDCFLSELGWREFSYYQLYHFPALPSKNFNPQFDAYNWRQTSTELIAWQRGQTGVPIVDAGMRELWQTGYMHNRVRMIVASYLVKNLGTHWIQGERWFWDCLLDADLAANSASWQWVAGCGADAAPFFRIFNPVLQGEKFDKKGDYVRQYCPELRALPDKYIHKPWEAPQEVLKDADIKLGKNYPAPLVDLKGSRAAALASYQAMKQQPL